MPVVIVGLILGNHELINSVCSKVCTNQLCVFNYPLWSGVLFNVITFQIMLVIYLTHPLLYTTLSTRKLHSIG